MAATVVDLVDLARKVNQIDNRGSQFYLTLYWAEALAKGSNAELAERFQPVYAKLSESEAKIMAELNEAQGSPVDVGGYYFPNEKLASKAMRPSATLNAIIASV